MYPKLFLVFASIFISSCATKPVQKSTFFNAAQTSFTYTGRTVQANDTIREFISSAASVVFEVKGDSLTFLMGGKGETHHYVVVELNGELWDRYRIESDKVNRVSVALPNKETNTIALYKATEASNGALLFYGVEAKNISAITVQKEIVIEYIGDSITCGFGADNEEISCDTGTWFDGHNAYLANGPLTARSLNAEFRLNAVSGMGMYRNWNDEDTAPVMGDVYGTTKLDGDTTDMWSFSGRKPDVVSICLGTNDISNGDGIKERKPFDAQKFTANYISFVEGIFNRYPNTRIALLTSPMVSGENSTVLLNCLQAVKRHFTDEHIISVFEFKPMLANGCGGHPDVDDNKVMADQLVPFYTDLLTKSD